MRAYKMFVNQMMRNLWRKTAQINLGSWTQEDELPVLRDSSSHSRNIQRRHWCRERKRQVMANSECRRKPSRAHVATLQAMHKLSDMS